MVAFCFNKSLVSHSSKRLEVWNQGVQRAILHLQTLEDNPSLALLGSGDCRYSLSCGCITQISVSLFTWPVVCVSLLCVSYKYNCHWTEDPLDNPMWSYLEILYLITFAKTLLPNMVTFKDLKDYPVDILFGEPPFNPLQKLITYRWSSVELKNKQKEK